MVSRPVDQSAYRGYPAQDADDLQESISVIDQYSNFDGTYNSTRDLRIEGQVKGTIECRGTLYIAQGANVDANVEAENISVAGELSGEVSCRGKLQLLPSGRVKGKIQTVTLVIHEGAFYEGDLEMAGPDGRIGTSRARRAASASLDRMNQTSSAPTPRQEDTAAEANSEPAAGSTPSAPNTFIRRFGGQEQQWESSSSSDEDTRGE